jgi:hypothetical protein
METEGLRAEFEKWFAREFPDRVSDRIFALWRDTGQYQDDEVEKFWVGYQAGASRPQGPDKWIAMNMERQGVIEGISDKELCGKCRQELADFLKPLPEAKPNV